MRGIRKCNLIGKKAWMIRNDGLVVPLKVCHVYGDYDKAYENIDEENTHVASFLYKYGKNKEIVKKYFTIYFAYQFLTNGITQNFESFIGELNTKFHEDIIDEAETNLVDLYNTYKDDVMLDHLPSVEEIKEINKNINDELNETFLRARYGGKYDDLGTSDMYFRISSVCNWTGSSVFSWADIIYHFVSVARHMACTAKQRLKIETVTVINDLQSLGNESVYSTSKNTPIFHLPVSDYFTDERVFRYGSIKVVRTCQFYTVGKSKNELLAYDEYGDGDGRYFTGDVFMCDRYNGGEADDIAKEKNLRMILVTITKKNDGNHGIEIGVY